MDTGRSLAGERFINSDNGPAGALVGNPVAWYSAIFSCEVRFTRYQPNCGAELMLVQISIGCRFGVEREGVKTQPLCLS